MQIGVIADDLTGAMDTGAQFSNWGLQTVLQVKKDYQLTATVGVVNTSSRELSDQEAKQRVQKAVDSLQGRLLYKKIDSTLRGHLAVEIKAILQSSHYGKVLVCPAVVAEKRQVIDGQLLIDGQSLHQTAFANDPFWPAQSSSIEDRLQEPTAKFKTQEFRGDPRRLRERFLASHESVLVPDALDQADLNCVAQALIDTDILPCGALSFATSWISALTGSESHLQNHQLSISRPLLFVVGSRHPCSLDQASRLVDTGEVVEILVDSDKPASDRQLALAMEQNRSVLLRTSKELLQDAGRKERMLDELKSVIRQGVEADYFGGYVVTGGETAHLLLGILSVKAIMIQGEVIAGLPFGTIMGGELQGIPIFTKAGGFGPPDGLAYFLNYIS